MRNVFRKALTNACYSGIIGVFIGPIIGFIAVELFGLFLADIGSAVTFAALMVGAFMAVGGLAIGFLTGAIVGFIQRIEVGLVLGAVIGSTLAVMFFANGLLSEQSTIIYGSSGAVVGLISALLIRRRERHQVKYTA